MQAMQMSSPIYKAQLIPDIYEKIVDFLGDSGDMGTFRSLALVSRDFLPLARKHLYGVLQVGDRSPHYSKKTCTTDLVRLLTLNPEIAHYVHTFYYTVSIPDFGIKGLAGVLKLMTQLHTFGVALRCDLEMRWEQVPLTLREAIIHLCHQPIRLEVSSLHTLILPEITQCVNVKELSIADLQRCTIEPGLQGKTLQLEKFSLFVEDNNFADNLCTAHYADGASVLDLSILKRVDLWFDGVVKGHELLGTCKQLTEIGIHGLHLWYKV